MEREGLGGSQCGEGVSDRGTKGERMDEGAVDGKRSRWRIKRDGDERGNVIRGVKE